MRSFEVEKMGQEGKKMRSFEVGKIGGLIMKMKASGLENVMMRLD